MRFHRAFGAVPPRGARRWPLFAGRQAIAALAARRQAAFTASPFDFAQGVTVSVLLFVSPLAVALILIGIESTLKGCTVGGLHRPRPWTSSSDQS
jgi:anaerobic C4-dicarboxylate transporter